jgi:peptidoglycan hydrolase-like protein with peptidoglycan-binding domain
MTRKFLLALIALLIVITGFGVYYYFFSNPETQANPTGVRSFFPFGQTNNNNNEPQEQEPTDVTPQTGNNPTLKTTRISKLSDVPVAGATLITKTRFIEPENKVTFDFVDFSKYPTLKQWDNGTQVLNLYKIINLTNETSTTPGELFDETLTNLVMKFQEKEGLSADGIVGRGTYAALTNFQNSLLGESEEVLAARYIKKEDGEIVDIYLDTKESSVASETVIPRIYEAFFGKEGSMVVLRYLDTNNETIETFGGSINEEKKEIEGVFFPKNISFVSLSPDKEKIFYLYETGDYTKGTISSLLNTNRKPIFEHAFSEWLPNWGTDSIIELTTKPSYAVEGNNYSLSSGGGEITKTLSDKKGLTTLASPNGEILLFNEIQNGSPKLFAYNKITEKEEDLGVYTLPEKCTFTKNSEKIYCGVPRNIPTGRYPDDWYKGVVSFNDTLWGFGVDENISNSFLVDPLKDIGLDFDITKINLSENEDYLIFIDKKTGTLYGLPI